MTARSTHFLCGIPGSGTTLLQDLLMQRGEDFECTYTTNLARLYGLARAGFSNSEYHLAYEKRKPEVAFNAMQEYLRGGIDRYLDADTDYDVENVLIKGWEWINHVEALEESHPREKVVVMMRNPFNAFLSMYRRARTPRAVVRGGTPHERFPEAFARYFAIGQSGTIPGTKEVEPGMIGGCLSRVDDLLQRQSLDGTLFPNVVFVQYEKLCQQPAETMRDLEKALDLKPIPYDFKDAPTFAKEDDMANPGVSHARKPGPVKLSDTDWRKAIPLDVAQKTAAQFPYAFRKFGYANA